MKFAKILLLVTTSCVHSATFIIGDGFALNGNETLADARESEGNGQTEGFPNASTNITFDTDSGDATNPFGDTTGLNGFQPLSVGRDFGGNLVRSQITFNLSGIEPAPDGFQYSVTSIALSIELSNNNQANGDTLLNIFAQTGISSSDINLLTGTLSGTPDTNFTVSSSAFPGQFLPNITLNNPGSLLDLNSDQFLSLTLDAPNVAASGTDFVFFGGGLGPTDGGLVDSSLLDQDGLFNGNVNQLAGTNFVQVSPRLIIETELVAVPEPSTVTIASFGLFTLLLRRKR